MVNLNNKEYVCPVDVTLGLIGGKWKLLILYYLNHFEKHSYSEFKADLPGVSEKMLSQQLKELERDLLIGKNQLSLKPHRVEYYLTEQGKSLTPLLQFIGKWGLDYLKKNDIPYEYIRNGVCIFKSEAETVI